MKKRSIPIRFRPRGWAVLPALLLIMSTTAELHAAEHANYRLKWIFNASVLGDLYADVHGFFAQQGLKVDVKAGGPERDAIMELELGRTEFGVASADQVIRALSKGARLVVVAQLFQVNPLQWMYRPDQMRIESLADLKGRRLGVTFGGNDEAILRTLLAKGGLGEKDVELFSVRNDFTPFLTKKVNFWPVYRNTQAVFLEAKLRDAGEPVAYFDPTVYGVKFVANSVITSRDILENRPQLVRRFMKSLMEGWKAALDVKNQGKALEVLQRHEKGIPPDILMKQIELTRSLIQPAPGIPIGAIDTAAWRQTEAIMRQQNLISAPVNIDAVLMQIPPD